MKKRLVVQADPQLGLGKKLFWDGGAHTLYWDRRPVKHFKREAAQQELILAAFQKAGWPPCLASASVGAGFTKAQLRDTIRNLNRSLRPFLHFRQEGCGTRICWEPLDSYPNATQK